MIRVLPFLLTLCLALPAAALAEKPLPPVQFSQFFSGVIALEDAIGEGDWDAAGTALAEIEGAYSSLRPSLMEQVGAAFLDEFSQALQSMGGAVEQRDKTQAKKRLIRAQVLIFRAMDFYRYQVHPVILVIDQYVDLATEAGVRGDLERVAHELEEVDNFLPKAGELLEKIGAGQKMRVTFRQAIERARKAANRQDVPRMLEELKKVKRISAGFVGMASRQ